MAPQPAGSDDSSVDTGVSRATQPAGSDDSNMDTFVSMAAQPAGNDDSNIHTSVSAAPQPAAREDSNVDTGVFRAPQLAACDDSSVDTCVSNSNEVSAVDSSPSSDHRTISEILSSEPELAGNGHNGAGILDKPLLHVGDTGPIMPSSECQSHGVTVDETHPVPSGIERLSMKLPESVEVTVKPTVFQPSATLDTGPEPSVTGHDMVREHHENELAEKVSSDSGVRGDKRTSLDEDGSKDNREMSDSGESTPRNTRSIPEEDISFHADESKDQTSSTLSIESGTKPFPDQARCEQFEGLQLEDGTPAADVDPGLRPALSGSLGTDAAAGLKDDEDLLQLLGSRHDDVSKSSSHSVHSPLSASSADNRPSSRSSATSSRRSASGASRAGNGFAADSGGSRSTSISDRSVSSRAHSRCSSSANNIRSSCSSKSDRAVSGRAEVVRSPEESRADSFSSKTYTVDSAVDSKVKSIEQASVPHIADVAFLPAFLTRNEGLQRRGEDVGADTDEDVADLEPDQPSPAKPTEPVCETVNEKSTMQPNTPVDTKTGLEIGLDEEVVNLKDEQLPEEMLDGGDSDLTEDERSLVQSGRDVRSAPRSGSEPRSDTSESRVGLKSEELERIISNAAAAVESFVTEDERRTPAKVGDVDDRCERMADGATRSLLTDAIDDMLAVRNHKIAAASSLTSMPAMTPLSPSALSDNAKTTASSSSDGQV